MDDVQAITKLIYSYGELIDLGDIEGFARLFEHSTFGTHGLGRPIEGSDAAERVVHRTVTLYDGRAPSTSSRT